MSGRIDVLGAIDLAATYVTGQKGSPRAYAGEDLREARAIVADLIAAANAVCGNTPPAGQPGHIDFGDALQMLQAAVSRIGDGA